jgi:hypothetical protein
MAVSNEDEMVRYPIRIPRESYRGSKRNLQQKNNERNMLIQSIENHVNKKLSEKQDGIHVMLSYNIAFDMGLDPETVRKILVGVDGGSNGFTVIKGEPKT